MQSMFLSDKTCLTGVAMTVSILELIHHRSPSYCQVVVACMASHSVSIYCGGNHGNDGVYLRPLKHHFKLCNHILLLNMSHVQIL